MTRIPSTVRAGRAAEERWPGSAGTTATRKPSRAASASRWGRSRTRRSSPASPISPIAMVPVGAASPRWEETRATASARSLAG